MNKSRWFLLVCVAFLSGILLCRYFFLGEEEKFFVILILFFVSLWIIGRSGRVFLIGVVVLCGGFFRFYIAEEKIEVEEGWVEFEGCVVEEVDVRAKVVKYIVESDAYMGRVLLNAGRYPVYEFGDCFKVSGKLQRPEKIEDFAYDDYLSRYGIYYVMYRARIEKVGENGGGFFGGIFWVKGIFEARLNKVYTEPYAGFMAGLVLGSRKGISESLMEDFNHTGLTHIVAVSGYNVALVIVVVNGMFGFLTRRVKVVFSVFFIFVFVILVGASASVVRAGVMGGISLMALYFGRQYAVFLSLMASALIMNLWNPKILVFDVGFQLSFLATLGIVLFSPMVEKFLKWVPGVFGFREALTLTLSAQITVLPVIIVNFERLSLVSPIANVFVLPFIPFAMLFGFFAVFFGEVVGFFGYLFLKIIIFFVEFFAMFKYASIPLSWSFWGGVVYYVVLARVYISKFC